MKLEKQQACLRSAKGPLSEQFDAEGRRNIELALAVFIAHCQKYIVQEFNYPLNLFKRASLFLYSVISGKTALPVIGISCLLE